MNYIRHLTGFFERIARDDGLNSSHISLYVALFQYWNMNRFQNPISIARDDVMQVSKISGKATYHKCLRDLHDRGYLRYEPSYNPYRGSLVYMVGMETKVDSRQTTDDDKGDPLNPPRGGLENSSAVQGVDSQLSMDDGQYREGSRKELVVSRKMNTGEIQGAVEAQEIIWTGTKISTYTASEPGTEQVLVPSINSINKTNLLNNESYRGENSGRQDSGDKDLGRNEKRSQEADHARTQDAQTYFKRDTVRSRTEKKKDIPAEISEVIDFFEAEKYPSIEARRFFNHFQSNGWKVGGKAPMKDWHAAARNWMLNYERFNRPMGNRGNIKAGGGKDYGEPL